MDEDRKPLLAQPDGNENQMSSENHVQSSISYDSVVHRRKETDDCGGIASNCDSKFSGELGKNSDLTSQESHSNCDRSFSSSTENVKQWPGETSALPPVKNTNGLSSRRVFQARLLSGLVMTFYMASAIGISPLVSQYVYLRLKPMYLNSSDNSSVDLNPCTDNASDARVQAVANLQEAVSNQLLYYTLAQSGPMILSAIVLGASTDVYGRKMLFFLPTVAGLIKVVATAVIIKVELSIDYFYLTNVLEGFSGCFIAVILATFAYTADLTAPSKSRTLAITILEACMAIAGGGCSIGVGYLIKYVDYFYAAVLMALVMAISVGMIFFLPETVRRHTLRSSTSSAEPQETPSRNPFKYVKHVYGFYFTIGSVRRRAQFILALTMLSICLIKLLGVSSVLVLFAMNAPFCWDSVEIGIFDGTVFCVKALASVIAVHLMQKCLSDVSVAAISLLSGVASNLIFGFATSSIWLYITIPVGAMSTMVVPVTRAILSKMAGASRQGALFTSIAVSEALCQLASSSLYNSVYTATVAVKPGAVFLCISGMTVVTLALLIAFKWLSAGHPLVSEEDASRKSTVKVNQGAEDSVEQKSEGN